MRIKPIHLAGVALALVGVNAKNALADTTVTTATTAPLQTSSAGTVIVNAGGSITVTGTQNAVTMDADTFNTANAGQLLSKDADDSAGIVVQSGGVLNASIANTGSIILNETYAISDTDGDGDLDGNWASGERRNGIWIQSGTLHGDITSAGAITIQGNDSNGIRLDGALDGALNVSGATSVTGDNSRAIAINGGGATSGVTGDVTLTGSVSVRGENSIGVLVDAPIGGALNISSAIATTALHSTTRPTASSVIAALDTPNDFLQSGASVQISGSVLHGVTFQGAGVENDTDDDHDGLTEAAGDTNDNVTASISSFGSAPALLITPDATILADVDLGATTPAYQLGYGLVNRGGISANSVYDGFDATAVRIAGQGGAHVSSALGFLNDGGISVDGFRNATGISIGADATIPTILNRNVIAVRDTSEDAGTSSRAIVIESLGHVGTIDNRGSISAQFTGGLGSAVAIRDAAGSLTAITNTGSIFARVVGSTASVTPTGEAIAIDTRGSTANLTLTQTTGVVFTDDDAVDDVANPTLQIIGKVLLGDGNDTVNLQAGTVTGDMDLGGGADQLELSGGAVYKGALTDSGNDLTIHVADATLNLSSGSSVTVQSANFDAASTVGFTLTGTSSTTGIITSQGAVTFASGSKINIAMPTGLQLAGSETLVTTPVGQLSYAGVLNTATTPFIYNIALTATTNSPTSDPDTLVADYSLKSAAQLGLDPNATSAYAATLDALRTDTTAVSALTSLTTNDQVQAAFASLMPNFSGAAAELTATAIQQSISATSNRLLTSRIRDQKDTSVWVQEIGYGVDRNSDTFGVDYRGWGFGFAGGIDAPLNNGALFGLSASFVASEVTQPARDEGELATSVGTASAYLGTSVGAIDLDFVAGGGIGKLKSRRQVQIGSTFSALADADWWAYEGHGSVRASMPISVSNSLVVTPRLGLTYVAMNEQSYDESGGGSAVNLGVDSTTSQRLWADAMVDLSWSFGHVGESVIAPHLSLGYRGNLIDDAADRTVHFLSGGPDFTLTDTTTGTGGPLIGLGIESSNGFSTLSLNYEGEFGDELTRHSLNASVRFRF